MLTRAFVNARVWLYFYHQTHVHITLIVWSVNGGRDVRWVVHTHVSLGLPLGLRRTEVGIQRWHSPSWGRQAYSFTMCSTIIMQYLSSPPLSPTLLAWRGKTIVINRLRPPKAMLIVITTLANCSIMFILLDRLHPRLNYMSIVF